MSSHDNFKNRERNCCDKKMSARDDDELWLKLSACHSYSRKPFEL